MFKSKSAYVQYCKAKKEQISLKPMRGHVFEDKKPRIHDYLAI